MTHEEFDQICTKYLKSQIKPESEDGLILAYRHEERLQLIIEHMPVHGLMELVSYLILTLGDPFLVMAAVADGLERIDGVGVERITSTGGQDEANGLREAVRVGPVNEEAVEWPEDIDVQ